MMKFVENPNLPVCADIVIIGEKYCKILQNGIKSLGINALFMPDNPYVDLLRNIRKMLKPNGKVLIAIEINMD